MWFIQDVSIKIHDSIHWDNLTIIRNNKIHFLGIIRIHSARKSRLFLKFMFRCLFRNCWIQLQRQLTSNQHPKTETRNNSNNNSIELTLNSLSASGSALRWSNFLVSFGRKNVVRFATLVIHVAAAIYSGLSLLNLCWCRIRLKSSLNRENINNIISWIKIRLICLYCQLTDLHTWP